MKLSPLEWAELMETVREETDLSESEEPNDETMDAEMKEYLDEKFPEEEENNEAKTEE